MPDLTDLEQRTAALARAVGTLRRDLNRTVGLLLALAALTAASMAVMVWAAWQ